MKNLALMMIPDSGLLILPTLYLH